MTRNLTIKTVALLGTTMLVTPAMADITDAERTAIRDRAVSELESLGFEAGDFRTIRIEVGRRSIEVDANGMDLEVDLTFVRDGNMAGALVEGDVDGGAGPERELRNGSWVVDDESDDDDDEYDDEDDDDEYDDRYDDDDDDDDDDDYEDDDDDDDDDDDYDDEDEDDEDEDGDDD